MKKTQFMILAFAAMMFSACQPQEQKIVGDFSNELTAEEIAGGKLSPEILWKFGRVGGGEVSPDEKSVVYSVSRYDAKTNKSTSNIFVIDVASKSAKKLTDDQTSDWAACWIENGKKLAYMSTASGEAQVWQMNADGSSKKQLSSVKGGINAFKFSPDGKHVLYTKDVKLDETIQEKHKDMPLLNARLADDLMYRHWNDWSDYMFSHIFVAPVNAGMFSDGKDIMEGEKWDAPLSPYFDDAEITWSPDGKTIAYTCKKLYGRAYAVSTNSDIYLYSLEKEETKNITEGMMGYEKYPVFSPDGSKIAFMSMETPGYEADKERLFVYDIALGNKEYINENWDQNAHAYQWSADGSEIYFISGIHATYQLYKVHLATKSFTQLTKGQHNINGFSKVGKTIVASHTTHQQASELVVVNEKEGTLEALTSVNKNIYDKIDMGRSEEKWVTTTDGKKMLVWVVYPPNFDPTKKYPALLYCQGGPQSAVSQFFSFRWNFAMMAANDYIVIAPNRRGLPSFGEEWTEQISGDYSGQNIQDYLSAVDAIKKEPFVDENRIGSVGASYGGYSVFYLAGHHQKRFKAFIAHCGMYNLESFYAATEETFFPNHDLGGAYWEKENKVAQKSYANSPHKFVQNWDTPIMIIHGGKDFRIPYTEALQAFNAAQLRGIPSRLLYFPEETHFVLKPQNSIVWQREFFEWLDTYLK